ncbi:MAG: hypothetical protein RB191_18615 [Terriglobia bacterium]|nr:hypothetical protein [Terriglobia bacterium]
MWIARGHFDLISEAAREFRKYHEEVVRTKDAIIQAQAEQIRVLTEERIALTDKLWTRQVEREKVPEVPETEPDSWEAIMKRQIQQIDEAEHGRAENAEGR